MILTPLSARSCSTRTTEGECCTFPFQYNGANHTNCTTEGNIGVPWCATSYNFNKDSKWGNCSGNVKSNMCLLLPNSQTLLVTLHLRAHLPLSTILRPVSTSANLVARTGTIACSSIEKKQSDWLSLILVAKKLNLIQLLELTTRSPVNARFQLGFRAAHALIANRLVARPNSPKWKPAFNYPRSAPIWSCSSVGRATVICYSDGSRGFESNRGQRYFLFLRVGPFPF